MSRVTVSVTYTDEEGCEVTEDVAAKYVVCGYCHGTGTQVNPSIDGNGISASEFAEDPDFAEAYMRGDYDIPCTHCNGKRVVAILDDEKIDADTLARIHKWREEQYVIDREMNYEERHLRMAESNYY